MSTGERGSDGLRDGSGLVSEELDWRKRSESSWSGGGGEGGVDGMGIT